MSKIKISVFDILCGLLVIALLAIHPVAAQDTITTPTTSPGPSPSPSPAPASVQIPETFQLEVNQADLAAISNALMELPKKIADPIITKLNAQLAKQVEQRNAAATAKSETAVPKQ